MTTLSRTAGLSLVALGLWTLAAPADAASLDAIIPRPLSQTPLPGQDPADLTFTSLIQVAPGDTEARWIADYLSDVVQRSRGLKLTVTDQAPPPGRTVIRLERRKAVKGAPVAPEAYDLDVAPGRITLTADNSAGLFYAAISLWSLITADEGRGPVRLDAEHIHDAPRYAWRGLMIDSARHFQSPAEIKRIIDLMALHKLNVLHWHLTDDQGWRLEIKAYPKLTEVGAWRIPAGAAAQADIDPATGAPRLEGGFYTQAQVREIVAYAARRQIRIVPELDMPGHAMAAIRAYPALGVTGATPPGANPSDWGIYPYLYNVDEPTFTFIQTVLDEVMALFPGPYIHLGGDEAVKDQWKASPAIQAKIKALGLKDEDALQGWFTHRMDDYLIAHGRRLVGWDEILEDGPLPPSATVMSWRGIAGAATAAKTGHDTVLSPAPTLYLDNRQSGRPSEPPGRGSIVSLKDVYDFSPTPLDLTVEQQAHILGLQGNLWTEHVRGDARIETMAFPRAAAVAETGWTAQNRRDWPSFAARMPSQMARYRSLDVAADDAAIAVNITAEPAETPGRAEVRLSRELGGEAIRYTTDGTFPTAKSPLYARPLDLPLPLHVRARAYVADRPVSPIAAADLDSQTLRGRASQQLKSCSGKAVLNLEDDGPVRGPRARYLVDIVDPCWIYPAADLRDGPRLSVRFGQIPFNFQLGEDRDKIQLTPPMTPQGELQVRYDRCDGPPAASAPLPALIPGVEQAMISVDLPAQTARHDLCFRFTAKSLDPMTVIDQVDLTPPPPALTAKGG